MQETVCGFFLFIFIYDEFPNVSRETFMFFLKMVFSFYIKNGIINKAELPKYGSVTIKTQDGQPIFLEIQKKEKIS